MYYRLHGAVQCPNLDSCALMTGMSLGSITVIWYTAVDERLVQSMREL